MPVLGARSGSADPEALARSTLSVQQQQPLLRRAISTKFIKSKPQRLSSNSDMLSSDNAGSTMSPESAGLGSRQSSCTREEMLVTKFRGAQYDRIRDKAKHKIKCRERECEGIAHAETFLARELVTALIEKKICADHHEAMYVSSQLLQGGYIQRVQNPAGGEFLCDLVPYRFVRMA